MMLSIVVFRFCDFMRRGCNKVLIEPGVKASLAQCGKRVKIASGCEIKPLNNVFIGNNTEIGPRALFWTTRAKIIIGNNVIFGPGVTIVTGDHPTNIVGKHIIDVQDNEKEPGLDADVVIADDVWIGCNVIILKGVHIAIGCVIAAGSIITRDTEPYAIYAGVPAKKIKSRFSMEELQQHLEQLNAHK